MPHWSLQRRSFEIAATAHLAAPDAKPVERRIRVAAPPEPWWGAEKKGGEAARDAAVVAAVVSYAEALEWPRHYSPAYSWEVIAEHLAMARSGTVDVGDEKDAKAMVEEASATLSHALGVDTAVERGRQLAADRAARQREHARLRAEAEQRRLDEERRLREAQAAKEAGQPGSVLKPQKYFSIDRVFRNEALDATHLAEVPPPPALPP